MLTMYIGVLYHRIERHHAHTRERTAYSCSFDNLASNSTVARRDIYASSFRSLNGYVWRLCDLLCWRNMVDNIFHSLWRVSDMADVDHLPSTARLSSRCSSPIRNDDYGQHLSTWTTKKPRLQCVRCLCCTWILCRFLLLGHLQ